MIGGDRAAPVLYGDTTRVVVMVEWLTRLVGRQPVEVLTDPGVNDALRRLGEAVAGWCHTDDAPGAVVDRRAS